MPIEIPKSEKVYTTQYQDFKGVDFTNDPSNVWYRRTPDGVNMLPDEAGRPFKRTGWEIVVTAAQIATLYAADCSATAPSEIEIKKCYYFELAGYDHIFVFTNYGVFIYRDGELLSSKSLSPTNVLSYEPSVIASYERAFFFEGATDENGGAKSAFYIYGDFHIWEYKYDETNGFTWTEAAPYIPRVNYLLDARHISGEALEEVNLLSDYIAEDYIDNQYMYVSSATTSISGATVTVDDVMFTAIISDAGTYVFTYTTEDHSWLLSGDQVTISNYGITLSADPADGSTVTITLSKYKRIDLPKRIVDITGMKVYVSESTQFDKQLTLTSTGTPSSTYDCVRMNPPGTGNSYLVFYSDWLPLVDGEDAIRVVYPRNAVIPTSVETNAIEINVGAGYV